MGQEGCHGTEAKGFSGVQAGSGGDARSPGVSVSQIAEELGIGVNVLGRGRRELRREPEQVFPGNGRPREEELGHLRRELTRVTKERDFLREAAAGFASASR
jgi:transposase